MDFDYSLEIITPDVTGTLTVGGTGAVLLPNGTTAQEPGSPVNGMMRYNSTTNLFEYYQNGAWVNSVYSVALSVPSIFTVSGSPVTSSGTLSFSLNTQTQNLVFASPNGSTGTPTFRALVNADLPASGVTANSYTNANITVNAQGIITTASNGTAGGVTSITGTANEITASASTGAVTLSTPNTFIAPGSSAATTYWIDPVTTISAAGASQGTATAITSSQVNVSTVAAGTGVILPASATTGTDITVTNNGANSLLVYPNTGGAINGGTTNAAVTVPVGQTVRLALFAANSWYSVGDILTAGTGITLTENANGITVANTGVTSVGLSDGSTSPIYTITNSPVTTTGTLTFTLKSQTANTFFAAPNGSAGQPSFRSIVNADFPTSGVTAGTFGQVTVNAQGIVTAGTTIEDIAHGGTGQSTAAAAYNALSPMTTTGDIEYEASANTAARLPIGTSGQVLTVSSGIPAWSTVGAASYSVLVGPSGSIAWSLVSGNRYQAIITHNLGTQNVIVQCANIANNDVVNPDLIIITSASQTTIQVIGNTLTLRVVIIANGASIAAGASTPSSVIVENSGVNLTGTYTTLNFASGLTAINSGGNVAIISTTVPFRTFTFYATSLDSPNNSDWTINALAPTVSDPTNGGLNVRQFSNTTEQGVGLFVPVPIGATNITLTYKGRSQTASAATLQMKLYTRGVALATPAAVSTWSAATLLTSVSVPANVFFQTFAYTATIASLSLTAGNMYQFEFTRNVSVAGNLAYNWLMVEFDVSFT